MTKAERALRAENIALGYTLFIAFALLVVMAGTAWALATYKTVAFLAVALLFGCHLWLNHAGRSMLASAIACSSLIYLFGYFVFGLYGLVFK